MSRGFPNQAEVIGPTSSATKPPPVESEGFEEVSAPVPRASDTDAPTTARLSRRYAMRQSWACAHLPPCRNAVHLWHLPLTPPALHSTQLRRALASPSTRRFTSSVQSSMGTSASLPVEVPSRHGARGGQPGMEAPSRGARRRGHPRRRGLSQGGARPVSRNSARSWHCSFSSESPRRAARRPPTRWWSGRRRGT